MPTAADVERILSLVKVLATGAARACLAAGGGVMRTRGSSRGTGTETWLCRASPRASPSPVRKLKEDRQPVLVSERLFVGSVGVRRFS